MRLERKYMPFMPVLALHTRTTTREDTTSPLFLSSSQTRTKNLQKYILPIDFLIQKFVAYDLAEHQESALNIDRFLHGNPIIPDGNFDDGDFKFQQSQIYRIYNQQKFIGTAEYKFFDALQTLCLCPLRLICSEQRCV